MSTDIKRDDTGIYTSEGNVAGDKAAKLSAARDKQRKEYEEKRKEIEETSKRRMRQMDSMFAPQTTQYEDEFKVGAAEHVAPRDASNILLRVVVSVLPFTTRRLKL